MIRFPTIVTAAFAVCITTAAYAAPAEKEIVASDTTLSLVTAKQAVRSELTNSGRRNVGLGSAHFTASGDVDVEVVNQYGVPVQHIIVHANGGVMTDARTGAAYKG